MILTRKQEEAVKLAVERYKHGEKYTVIAGWAGSGKSTTVKFVISALESCGIDPDVDVVYTSFTGKATQVLQKKGNKNVSTLHKLLYDSKPRSDGTFFRIPVNYIDYKIIVIDELSMIPKDMIELLFSYDVHVIGLGDNGQLPPIYKNDDNHLLEHPHIFLDEIMRQARESEIIRLTMAIREGKTIQPCNGKEIIITDKSVLNTGMLQWADQILVATNKTRVDINNKMRELMNRGDRPEDGDKIICLRNYWEDIADNGDALVNGTVGFLRNPCFITHRLPYNFGGDCIDVVVGKFETDGDSTFDNLEMDQKMILTGERCIENQKRLFRITKNKRVRGLIPKEFTYGYAITLHRAQGSEWDNVLILEENFPFDRQEHKQWLYTAATRAAKRLVLIRK